MKAFLAWTGLVTISVLLGVALYSTSLQGSPTGYRESVFSPRPVPTVVKLKTKIIRKPAKTKVVYVAPTPAPVSTAQAWTPPSSQQTTSQTTPQTSGKTVASSSDHSSSDHSRKGDD